MLKNHEILSQNEKVLKKSWRETEDWTYSEREISRLDLPIKAAQPLADQARPKFRKSVVTSQ